MRFEETVKVTVLPSGVTVITDYFPPQDGDSYQGHLAAEIVMHRGSLHDPIDKNGLAHKAEHLMAYAIPGISRDKYDEHMTKYGPLNHNLNTGFQMTRYWANGQETRVRHYLNETVRGMYSLAYTPQDVADETPRIVNEMKNKLIAIDCRKDMSLIELAFGGQPHAQWRGGYPEHLNRISYDDIRAYHDELHRTGNIVLITAGTWTHDQACEWAEENLSTLPYGKRAPTLRSTMTARDAFFANPFMSHPHAGDMASFKILYDISHLSPADQQALALGNTILNNQLHKYGKDNGIYGLGLNLVDEITETPVSTLSSTAIDSHLVHPILLEILNESRDILNHLTADSFQREKNHFIQESEEPYKNNGRNPYFRFHHVAGGYKDFNDPLIADKRRNTRQSLTLDGVVNTMMNLYSRVPATFYTAATQGNFPTGLELQHAWATGAYPKSTPSALRQAIKDSPIGPGI